MPSKLILTRKEEFINRRQRFKVFIDDKQVGLIKNGETQEYELAAGSHTVHCTLNWTSSRNYTVEIKEETNTYVTVSNGMRFIFPLYIMMIVGILLPFYFKFARLPMPEVINTVKIILIVPALVYILLYTTVYRKKYLYIGEDKSNPFR